MKEEINTKIVHILNLMTISLIMLFVGYNLGKESAIVTLFVMMGIIVAIDVIAMIIIWRKK